MSQHNPIHPWMDVPKSQSLFHRGHNVSKPNSSMFKCPQGLRRASSLSTFLSRLKMLSENNSTKIVNIFYTLCWKWCARYVDNFCFILILLKSVHLFIHMQAQSFFVLVGSWSSIYSVTW
jgi:hypothetical protein